MQRKHGAADRHRIVSLHEGRVPVGAVVSVPIVNERQAKREGKAEPDPLADFFGVASLIDDSTRLAGLIAGFALEKVKINPIDSKMKRRGAAGRPAGMGQGYSGLTVPIR